MALKSIQLATISPSNRAKGQFTVDAHSDSGDLRATFDCDSEDDAIRLRNAIRAHASRLRSVADFSDECSKTPNGPVEPGAL